MVYFIFRVVFSSKPKEISIYVDDRRSQELPPSEVRNTPYTVRRSR